MSAIEHGPDCRPEDMSEPDEEGIRDCRCCGLWETRYYSDGERDVKYQSNSRVILLPPIRSDLHGWPR